MLRRAALVLLESILAFDIVAHMQELATLVAAFAALVIADAVVGPFHRLPERLVTGAFHKALISVQLFDWCCCLFSERTND